MNFRSCKYFLAVCEAGTINAAARKLYISQQSLSQHIKRLEEEVGAQLFHRDTPLELTEAGKCVQRAARTILDTLAQMDREIAASKGAFSRQLTIGLLDYGMPEFLPPIIDLFLKKEPDVTLRTRELMPGEPLPRDVPLFISARTLGDEYRCEVIISDRLGVCVADSLLQKLYGSQWQARREQLRGGSLAALEGCPFLRHRETPMEPLQDMAFASNGFTPNYLRVMGSANAFGQMCINGQGAMIMMLERARREPGMPECCPILNTPESIPTAFICSRADAALSPPAQRFLEITRRYFSRNREQFRAGS